MPSSRAASGRLPAAASPTAAPAAAPSTSPHSSRRRDPDCPDLVIIEYTVEDDDGDASGVLPPPATYSVSRVDAAANLRRFAIGFDLCHLGCSRCGKGRGICGCPVGTKVRRARRRPEVAADVRDAVECRGGGSGLSESEAESELEDDGPAEAVPAALPPASPASAPDSEEGSVPDSEAMSADSWIMVESAALVLEG